MADGMLDKEAVCERCGEVSKEGDVAHPGPVCPEGGPYSGFNHEWTSKGNMEE